MRIIIEQDVFEVMDEIELFDHPITKVFGEEAVENYIERRYDLVEFVLRWAYHLCNAQRKQESEVNK